MKVINYSDIHYEFGHTWGLPDNIDGDVMLLAGDIVVSRRKFLPPQLVTGELGARWDKPVIYVTGNHEYYSGEHMRVCESQLQDALHPYSNIHLLRNESIEIDGVYFFGGTMWTDFNNGDGKSMDWARIYMNDFRQIRYSSEGRLSVFTPMQSCRLHKKFRDALVAWFESTPKEAPHVVLTHHAPVAVPMQENDPTLQYAFICTDMQEIIEKYAPALWVYGHLHESYDGMCGKTRLISNPLGYYSKQITFPPSTFDPLGKPCTV